ncbi:MAG TPA: UDP-glucose/GDP-mannose dehydrogenase family protein [Burkholderiaceae bacterium]|jgi:UDPglucose 6-dehydrogenase
MKISIVGSGYVGLVTGACLADMGNDVVCVDVDERKIAMLKRGEVPIHEPGLQDIMQRNAAAGRLRFTSDVSLAVEHGTMQFICVGTPADQDGSADLGYVLDAARHIGRYMTDYKVIVHKSTVPVGTGDTVEDVVRAELALRKFQVGYAVVSNPEFLKEGAAVADFMRPDRVIVGTDDQRAALLMRALYAPFVRNRDRLLLTDRRSAEFTKYAANAMLATRISFMNELAFLAEKVGADIEHVRQGIGSDPRIGTQFLYAGTGYGGSCFPKDVRAFIQAGESNGIRLKILEAVEAANERQKTVLVDKIVARFGEDLSGRQFAIWGLAFKPETNDMRHAPSLAIIEALARRGAAIVAYDPVAMVEAEQALAGVPNVLFAKDQTSALHGSDALLVVTEWREFKSPDFEQIKRTLKQPVVVDGRNLYDPALMREFGIVYECVGRHAAPDIDHDESNEPMHASLEAWR